MWKLFLQRDVLQNESLTMSIAQQYQSLLKQLPDERLVRVVVVSKYASCQQMIEAFNAGARVFGENRVQDVEKKKQELPQEIVNEIEWHFIGHLQRNKVNKAIQQKFKLIHSVDSYPLAQRLSMANEEQSTTQPVLLQVNILNDPNKHGYKEEQLLHDYPQLLRLPGIQIHGLMTIGPFPVDEKQSLACFAQISNLRDRMEHAFGHDLPELSMGMSQDFVHAIKSGATIIRVGSQLFKTE